MSKLAAAMVALIGVSGCASADSSGSPPSGAPDAAAPRADGAVADGPGGPGTDAGPGGAPDAAIDAAPPDAGFAAIPPADLGSAVAFTGTCAYAYRGWTFNDTTGCSPSDSSSSGDPSQRAVTVAADGSGGYTFTTTLRVDPLTGMPEVLYTVDLSEAQPMQTAGDTGACDPIYATCVTHTWTLSAHGVHLTTHSLHDNSSTYPLGQCWEYYYQSADCELELDY